MSSQGPHKESKAPLNNDIPTQNGTVMLQQGSSFLEIIYLWWMFERGDVLSFDFTTLGLDRGVTKQRQTLELGGGNGLPSNAHLPSRSGEEEAEAL